MHYVVEALNSVIFFLPSGVAIQMTEAVYAAPSLNAELTDAIFLQLDMCAAPGIKHYYTNHSTQTVYHTHTWLLRALAVGQTGCMSPR